MHPKFRMGLALVLAVCCHGAAMGQQPGPDPVEIVRRAAENDQRNDELVRNYTYIQRNEVRIPKKPTTAETYDAMILYGDQVLRHIAHNDQPLPAREQAKEEEKIQKIMRQRQGESEKERQDRLAKAEKRRDEGRAFVKEIMDAFDFRLAGEEEVAGRDAYIIDATPRPGYKPVHTRAGILRNVKFRVWIEKSTYRWINVDVEVIKPFSLGWVLARLHERSRIHIEQTWVNDEVWMPNRIFLNLDGRVLLVKGFAMEMEITYRDYRKFRVDTKITSPAVVQPQ